MEKHQEGVGKQSDGGTGSAPVTLEGVAGAGSFIVG